MNLLKLVMTFVMYYAIGVVVVVVATCLLAGYLKLAMTWADRKRVTKERQ